MKYLVNPTTYETPKVISFDTEYTELDIRKAKLLSVSIGVSEDLTYIFEASYYEELDKVAKILDTAETLYTWNMVVDWYMLSKYSIGIDKDKIIDAMLMEHLIDERLDHGLGDFAKREYNDNYKAEFWKDQGGEYEKYQDAPKEVAYEYEMRDGCYTYRAGAKYCAALSTRVSLVQHVHRLQWSLFETEIAGIAVNEPLIRDTKESMFTEIQGYLPLLRKAFSESCNTWELQKWKTEISKRKSDKGKLLVPKPTFSFASDKNVSWLVYDALECPVIEKTETGNPSTAYETLKTLSETVPDILPIVEYKGVKSVYSTFVEGLLDRVDSGRIYPRFNINGTATGRISHSNPNMGNIPKEGIIRNFFIPDEGCSLIGADYSQLEVVVEANLTGDPQLLKIILEGVSKHDITAQGLSISRDAAKTLNFALQYGAGAKKISKLLDVSFREAEDIYDRYWKLYAGVKNLKDQTAKTLEADGCVTNLFGRTRHFDKPKNEWDRFKKERQAYSHMVQGVGADMTNMATYLIQDFLKANGMGRLWFSVHDEIVCEIKKSWTAEATYHILQLMDEPNKYLNLTYPVKAKPYGPLEKWEKT